MVILSAFLRCCQVYVTVYSDGPTRVLRFSDEPNITSREAEQTVLDLAARLQQVGTGFDVQHGCDTHSRVGASNLL